MPAACMKAWQIVVPTKRNPRFRRSLLMASPSGECVARASFPDRPLFVMVRSEQIGRGPGATVHGDIADPPLDNPCKAGSEKSRPGHKPPLGCFAVSTSTGIRLAEISDADVVAAIYAPNITEGVASFELVPPDAEEMARRMTATLATYPWLVCEHAGRVIGYVYASQHNPRTAYQWSTNVTVYIDPAFHRRNVGRALYVSLFALLRLQGFYNAYGGITLPNAGSVGLHEALGFVLVGIYRDVGYKLGRWHDVGWWGLDLQEKPVSPPAPLDLAKATKLPEWPSALGAGAALFRFGGR